MRIGHFSDTDSLYIDLAGRPGADALALGDGIVLDLNEEGRPTGFDIDQASRHLDWKHLDLKHIPFEVRHTAGS